MLNHQYSILHTSVYDVLKQIMLMYEMISSNLFVYIMTNYSFVEKCALNTLTLVMLSWMSSDHYSLLHVSVYDLLKWIILLYEMKFTLTCTSVVWKCFYFFLYFLHQCDVQGSFNFLGSFYVLFSFCSFQLLPSFKNKPFFE